uniref:Retrovirus-related Pol polyprotein from transposon TNT 1-94 n=1 Tax=Strongyloides papillosus TaxID=174720 RepID=A0A0N5CAE9_STREA
MATKNIESEFLTARKLCGLEPLTDENYAAWKDTLSVVFLQMGKKFDDVLEGKDDDKISAATLRTVLSSNLRTKFLSYDSTSEILKQLKARYESTPMKVIVDTIKELIHVGGSPLTMMDEIANCKRRLEKENVILPDQFFIGLTLSKLNDLGNGLLHAINKDTSFSAFFSMVASSMQFMNANKVEDSPVVFKAYGEKLKPSGIVCFRCGKPGHIKRNCRVKLSAQIISEDKEGYGFVADNGPNFKLKGIYIDSGCTEHMITDKSLLINLSPAKRIKITFANNQTETLDSAGWLNLGGLILKNCYYHKSGVTNLLSSGLLDDLGLTRYSDKGLVGISDGCVFVPIRRVNRLYEVLIDKAYKVGVNASIVDSGISMAKLWHLRLGHPNRFALKDTANVDLVEKCEVCCSQKIKKIPHKKSTISTAPLQLLFADIGFPKCGKGLGDYSCYLIVVDDFSKITCVRSLKDKSALTVKDALEDIIVCLESACKQKVVQLRTDNGCEFKNSILSQFLLKKNISIQYTNVECPQQNTAERYNQTLKLCTSTLMYTMNIPVMYWPEIIVSAAYLRNRIRGPDGLSPLERAGLQLDIGNLKVIGCMVFVKNLDIDVTLLDKSQVGILVGFGKSSVSYRIALLSQRKIIESCNVTFLEDKNFLDAKKHVLEFRQSKCEDDFFDDMKFFNDKLQPVSEISSPLVVTDVMDKTFDNSSEIKNDSIASRVTGRRRQVNCMAIVDISEKEALMDDKWLKEMQDEVKKLTTFDVYETVDRKNASEVLPGRWVYTRKPDGSLKARYVIKGFKQEAEIINFSPTTAYLTIRLFLILASSLNFKVATLDISSAFLQSGLSENIFVEIPLCCNEEKSKVWRLKKALYGLRQAPKAWNNTVTSILLSLGLVQCQCDFSVFKNNDGTLFITIYVDDFLFIGKNESVIDECVGKLKEKLTLKYYGLIKENERRKFTGYHISRVNGAFKLDMVEKIEELLHQYPNIQESKTPFYDKSELDESESLNDAEVKKFQSLLGSISYIAYNGRPDITFITAKIARKAHAPTKKCWLSLLQIVNGLDLITYSDASFATPPDLVCTSGMCIYAGGKLVHWKSSKQKSISKSTFTAELYSCVSAVEYTVYVKKFLEFFISRINKPTLCIDNVPLYKSLQKDFGYTSKAKATAINFLYLKNELNNMVLKVVSTDLMKADPLTKVSNKLKSLFAGEVS